MRRVSLPQAVEGTGVVYEVDDVGSFEEVSTRVVGRDCRQELELPDSLLDRVARVLG